MIFPTLRRLNALALSLTAIISLSGACAIDTHSQAKKPSHCDPMLRSGTYDVKFITLSGDCGEVASTLVILDPRATPADLQSHDSNMTSLKFVDDVWSADECSNHRHITYTYNRLTDVSAIMQTADIAGDGSLLEGELSVTVGYPALCSGVYKVTYTKRK